MVVVGASNLDIIARTNAPIVAHDSNRGTIIKTPGGVARNIAENLGRLGIKPILLTALSDDADGNYIKAITEQSGVKVVAKLVSRLPTYIAVLDEKNDMVVGINDMESFDDFTVTPFKRCLKDATHIVVDLNVSSDVLDALMNLKARLYVDGISTVKVKKITPYLKLIDSIKLNYLELQALTKQAVEDDDSLKLATQQVVDAGVKNVYVTHKDGVLWGTPETMKYYPTIPVQVKNTTGAGDAFLAGVVYGDYSDQDPVVAGLSVAKYTLETLETVSQFISKENIESLMGAYHHAYKNK